MKMRRMEERAPPASLPTHPKWPDLFGAASAFKRMTPTPACDRLVSGRPPWCALAVLSRLSSIPPNSERSDGLLAHASEAPTGWFHLLPDESLGLVFLQATSICLRSLSRTCTTFARAVRRERWSTADAPALLLLRLHVAGYVVLTQVLPTLDDKRLTRVTERSTMKPIFNGLDEDGGMSIGDGKRRAVPCTRVHWKLGEEDTTLAAVMAESYSKLMLRCGLLEVATSSVAK
jgi:hypothetical protein